jgi:predicted TIM-barrel fold metal-dependent hydrolase
MSSHSKQEDIQLASDQGIDIGAVQPKANRRSVLRLGAAAGGAFLGLGMAAANAHADAGTAAPGGVQDLPLDGERQRDRIDVHAHFIPAFYRQALIDAGLSKPDGIRGIPEWDEASMLGLMDQLGVATAMLSISSPGVHFGDDSKARALSRRINEEARRLADAHPGRFGSFASLPLPDVQGALEEAVYALDTLRADGVVFESNQHGMYLGDPKLDSLYAELDRRRAVIFVHPTSPACDCSSRLRASYPQPMLEFIFDTTRSISDMVLSGVLKRYPNLRVIVPHAGAALPMLTERIELLLPLLGQGGDAVSMRTAMRTLHFDLAGAPVPEMLGALLQVADPSHIHYGSDYPFTPADSCNALLKIETTPLLDHAMRRRVLRDNSRALFPHLAGRTGKQPQ